jgi:hypothetical protein
MLPTKLLRLGYFLMAQYSSFSFPTHFTLFNIMELEFSTNAWDCQKGSAKHHACRLSVEL